MRQRDGIERLIGERVKHHRLRHNFSQSELAKKAGLSRRTITNIENGAGGTLSTLIRILRVLDQLSLLSALIEEPPPSPVQLHRAAGGKKRKNASKPRKKPNQAQTGWKWGDEQ